MPLTAIGDDGNGPSGVNVRNVRISNMETGVEIAGGRNIRLHNVSTDSLVDTAVHMDGCDQVSIQQSLFIGSVLLESSGQIEMQGMLGGGQVTLDSCFAISAQGLTGNITFDSCFSFMLDAVADTAWTTSGKLLVLDACHDGIIRYVSEQADGDAVSVVDCFDLDLRVNLQFSDRHGVYVEDSQQIKIRGRVTGSSQETVDTWDNVHVTGANCSAVDVSVTSRPDPAQTRTGVFIDSGVPASIVNACDFGVAADYATADFTDNGTGTRVGTNWSL